MNEFDIVTVIGPPADEVFAFSRGRRQGGCWIPKCSRRDRRAMDRSAWAAAFYMLESSWDFCRFESVSECTEYTTQRKVSAPRRLRAFHLEIGQHSEFCRGGTRLANNYRGESRGFFKLAEPVVVRLTKETVRTADREP